MKNWQKLLALSLTSAALLGFSAPADAAYQLNSDVRHPTMALKTASQIGVLSNENTALANLPNKDAIVVMCFGTTYPETRAATIDATVAEIQKAHPGVKVVTAYTSHIIIDRVKKNEGLTVPTPEKALDDLKGAGYTRVALVSLDVIPGMEYSYDVGVFHGYKDKFKKMTLSTPLVYWQGQEEQDDDVTDTMKALSKQFPKMGSKDAVLILDHGTPHPANAYYSVMQAKLQELGLDNAYIYTVEGWPNLETVIPKLKAKGINHVTLMPMMMVAGDHANNDMAGDEEDSHKSILEAQGFKVDTYLHGIGENRSIRGLYLKRANDAWDALIK